jgi:hypothetical protein
MRKAWERRFFFAGIGEHSPTREAEADEDEAAYCLISATLPPYHLFCQDAGRRVQTNLLERNTCYAFLPPCIPATQSTKMQAADTK